MSEENPKQLEEQIEQLKARVDDLIDRTSKSWERIFFVFIFGAIAFFATFSTFCSVSFLWKKLEGADALRWDIVGVTLIVFASGCWLATLFCRYCLKRDDD